MIQTLPACCAGRRSPSVPRRRRPAALRPRRADRRRVDRQPGDLLQRWTNDRWRSTMHRVVAASEAGGRLSIAFFHNANWDPTVECIVADGEAPRYPPTTAGHHLMEKFRSTVM
ncbi:MAG: 2OG-Fe(II) oxygenase family protein [Ilumatobacteraceae bacterium]